MSYKQFEYTKDNHWRFGYRGEGYNGRPRLWRINDQEKFWADYGRCERKPGTLKEESINACRLIYDSTDLPITVMYSGGLDSEFVVAAFKESGVPFDVLIARYLNDVNIYDVSHAVIFCENHSIKYKIVDIDLHKFLEDEIYKIAEFSRPVSSRWTPQMKIAQYVDGLPVMGGGDTHCVKKGIPEDYEPGVSEYPIGTKWYLQEYESETSWDRYMRYIDRPAVVRWFQYTPELMLAYLNDPVMHELVEDKRIGKLSNWSSKVEILQRAFPFLQPRIKKHGMEGIDDLFHQLNLDYFYRVNKSWCDIHEVEYYEMLQKLGNDDYRD